jgi:4-hydroxyproline epimerase
MRHVQVIDSHTGGEPTRVVIAGGPNFGGSTIAEQLHSFRSQHDQFRSAVVNEPRGSDVLVGAILVEPSDRSCKAAVIFFNNVGYLGMCGHGMIGLIATLQHLGRIDPGEHRIETPVGIVTATLHSDGSVSVRNVASHRKVKGLRVDVPGVGSVSGDVAWGGNWFFLVHEQSWELELSNVEKLTELTWRIRQALNSQGFPEVDHVELFAPAQSRDAHSRNFVLCPGKAYDRSPCGTGTSAKLACLFTDGKLKAGEIWRQESITGSVFEGSVQEVSGQIVPTIKGAAFVNSEARLIFNPADPYCWGIRSA